MSATFPSRLSIEEYRHFEVDLFYWSCLKWPLLVSYHVFWRPLISRNPGVINRVTYILNMPFVSIVVMCCALAFHCRVLPRSWIGCNLVVLHLRFFLCRFSDATSCQCLSLCLKLSIRLFSFLWRNHSLLVLLSVLCYCLAFLHLALKILSFSIVCFSCYLHLILDHVRVFPSCSSSNPPSSSVSSTTKALDQNTVH